MSNVLVVGGSMGGLLVANILLREGWDVQIYERSWKGLEARGAGITPQQDLLDALVRAGATTDSDLGITLNRRMGYDLSGAVTSNYESRQRSTSWGFLYNLLRDAFPAERFHAGAEVVSVEQDEARVHAQFADGSRLSADLLIGADGIRSTIREQVFPDATPRYAGYIAWRGMIEERDVPEIFAGPNFTNFNFCFPEGEEVVAYPVAGGDGSVEPGTRRFNIMWYRPVEYQSELRDLLTGSDGIFYPNGIPPHLIREEHIIAIREDAQRLLPPAFASIICEAPTLFFQAIYDLVSESIGKGRVALVGDAAFVARPHCGAGVTKAAGDATALADALTAATGVAEALDAYSGCRVPAGETAVEWARRLGSYFLTGEDGRRLPVAEAETPVSTDFIIRYTGIDLSEVSEAH